MALEVSPHVLLPAAMCLLHVLFFVPATRVFQCCRRLQPFRWRFGRLLPDSKLQRLLLAKRKAAWREFVQHLRHFGALYYCVKVLRLVMVPGEGRLLGDALPTILAHASSQLFCCFYVGLSEDTGLGRLCARCCRCWNHDCSPYLEWARTPFVAYFFCQALVEIYLPLQEATTTRSWVPININLFVVRIVVCVVNKRLDQAVMVNGVMAALSIYLQGKAPSSEEVAVQLYMFVALVILSGVLERLLLRETLRELEAKDSRSVESSIERMLCGVCDAVVHLNSDLILQRRSPQLDALLLKSAPGDQKVGAQAFLDLLHDDSDKEAFRNFIWKGMQADSLPGTLHVAMRDTNQMRVPVQVFHTQYVDAGDDVFHIIGLREFGDGDAQVRQQTHLAEPPTFEGSAHESRRRPSSQDSVSELGSQLSNFEVLPQVLPDEGAPDEVAVWVEPYRNGWPMCQCTQAFFASIGGPSLKQGTKLLHWVPRHQRATAEAELQTLLNMQVSGASPKGGGAHGDLQVCLRPSHMGGRLVHACVALSVVQRLSDRDSDGPGRHSDDLCAKITCTSLRISHARGADRELSRAPRPLQGAATRAPPQPSVPQGCPLAGVSLARPQSGARGLLAL